MSYQYRKTGSGASNARDFGGLYYNPINLSHKNYGSSTSNSISRNFEKPYTSKYSGAKSFSRTTTEPITKSTYGISGKYNINDYNFEYKPIRKSVRELSNSPSIKYSSMRFNETSPYSTYSSRQGSNSYLSDKESSKYIPSSISSRDSVSFVSPSNSYSINNRELTQKDTESKNKEPLQSPKQSSYVSKYKRNLKNGADDPSNNSDEKLENELKYDMISKTSRGTITETSNFEDMEKECSLISRTRVRKYPKQNVRIEMGNTVLVGNLSQVGKDISTQTSDDIFLPSPRIRQPSYKSGSSKSSISTSLYYNRGIDNKYNRASRSSWRQRSIDSQHSSVPKIEENIFFDNYSKSSSKEQIQSPKSSIHKKITPISIKDSIEKVNEWQIQNQILESENSSNRSPVPRSPNYHDLHAVTKSPYHKSSTLDETNGIKENLKDTKENGISVLPSKNLYVTKYTDLDVLLEDQFLSNGNSNKQNKVSKLDSYNQNLEDSPILSNESTLLFSSKASKEIFNSMSIDLQHIIINSKNRKIKFIDLLDICRNENHMKKFSDESERSFRGYVNINEMLIDLGIDIEKLENSVLQLCKFKDNQTEYGPFLDFDLSVQEQIDDLDGYIESGNIGVILRTKLSIKVAALIDKISNSNGKELRRALFSLKQIFQDDKDLVQEFVAKNGLQFLRQIGSKSDQNHQNYILRALGQLMLYVDGMNGVLDDSETIEWLYSLLQGSFRLVVKLALKLLVLFIEYAKDQELHASVIISSINKFHQKMGGKPWSFAIKILSDDEANDSELVTYAITFINKVLSSIPDQDTFYDVTDWLEEQGMEQITKFIENKSNADVDMIKQFKIYEVALQIEDGEKFLNTGNEGIRNLPRAKSETKLDGPRKSKRIQIDETKNESCNQKLIIEDQRKKNDKSSPRIDVSSEKKELENSDIDEPLKNDQITIKNLENEINRMHQPMRRKYINKEQRIERYKSLGNLYQEKPAISNLKDVPMSSSPPSRPQSLLLDQNENSVFLENVLNTVRESILSTNNDVFRKANIIVQPEIRIQSDSQESSPRVISPILNQEVNNKNNNDISKQTVKAMKNQFSSKQLEVSKSYQAPTGDVSGIISFAKDNLLSQKIKPPTEPIAMESKKESTNTLPSDTLDWKELEKECLLELSKSKEWNFLEIKDHMELVENEKLPLVNGVPLPPIALPSPLGVPPAPNLPKPPPAPNFKNLVKTEDSKHMTSGFNKQKRTTRLHWRALAPPLCNGINDSTIWIKVKQLKQVNFNHEKFESLFENKPHDFKKDMHDIGPKKLEVLDVKRSNAINIGMKNLVSIDCMKNAILNMTSSVINREGVEKLLKTMLPTQEEIESIKAAQKTNKDSQLGQAEKFLLDLYDIDLLQQRLEVWLFQLDFDQVERDILESLSDLKSGIDEIYVSETLICVLSTILKLGNFLNETDVNAFNLEYLQKVPEVKDTKHKHSLLFHVVTLVVNEYPNTTDLHSDLGSLNRCHRVDWEELTRKLDKLEKDCVTVWNHLKLIFKSDHSILENIKKLKEFFSEASKRIMKMKIIHKLIMTRYYNVLKYLGFSSKDAKEIGIRYFCKILSDFAIEYRTTREKIQQHSKQKEKEKKRIETKGLMIFKNLDSHSKGNENNDLLDVLCRTNHPNSDCDSDFNSLNNRRARRLSNQPPTDKSSNRTFPRPSSSHQMRNIDSSPSISNMTPATSEMNLDKSDTIDQLTKHAVISPNKRRTTRKEAVNRERKSIFY